VLLLVVLVGAAAAGMWVLQMDAQVTPAQDGGVREIAADERTPFAYQPNTEGVKTEGMRNAQIKRQFEEVINGFLEDLSASMKQYREKRQTVSDIIKPNSMRSFEYVQENNIFARTLMTELEVEAESVTRKFDDADERMKDLLAEMDRDDADLLLQEWNVTKNTQLNKYNKYFEQEQRIFDFYRIILDVYTQSGGAYTVNQNNSTVNFEDEKLQQAYNEAKYKVDEIVSRRND
jgi:hypothetical protein